MIQTNRLTINAIGKIKKPWIKEGIDQYKKRMPDLLIREFKYFKINNFKGNRDKNIVISLGEEGKSFNSKEFSSLLLNFNNQKITFLLEILTAYRLNLNIIQIFYLASLH